MKKKINIGVIKNKIKILHLEFDITLENDECESNIKNLLKIINNMYFIEKDNGFEKMHIDKYVLFDKKFEENDIIKFIITLLYNIAFYTKGNCNIKNLKVYKNGKQFYYNIDNSTLNFLRSSYSNNATLNYIINCFENFESFEIGEVDEYLFN